MSYLWFHPYNCSYVLICLFICSVHVYVCSIYTYINVRLWWWDAAFTLCGIRLSLLAIGKSQWVPLERIHICKHIPARFLSCLALHNMDATLVQIEIQNSLVSSAFTDKRTNGWRIERKRKKKRERGNLELRYSNRHFSLSLSSASPPYADFFSSHSLTLATFTYLHNTNINTKDNPLSSLLVSPSLLMFPASISFWQTQSFDVSHRNNTFSASRR